MTSYYLIKFENELTENQKEMIFNSINKIYDDDNKVIDFMQIFINDLMEVG